MSDRQWSYGEWSSWSDETALTKLRQKFLEMDAVIASNSKGRMALSVHH